MKSPQEAPRSADSSGRPGRENSPAAGSPFRFVAPGPTEERSVHPEREDAKQVFSGPSKPTAIEAVQGAAPARKTVLPPPRSKASVKEEMEARRLKAAEAAPLERRPRPAKDERKKLIEEVVRQETTSAEAALTPLPPKKKTIAPENTALVDPFETNEEMVRELGLGDVLASIQEHAPISTIVAQSVPKPRRTIVDNGGKTPDVVCSAPATAEPLPPKPRPAADEKPAVKTSAKAKGLPTRRKSQEELAQLTDLRSLDRISTPKTLENWVESVRNAKGTTALEESLDELARKPTEEAKVSKSRLRFHCPACFHSISMPKKIAGQKTRCPQCDSAIKAPDPKHRKTAHNYERHIEALLHPENFPMPAAPRPKFMGLPIPTPHQSIVGTAAAMLVCGGIFSLNMKGKISEQARETPNVALVEGVTVEQQKEAAAQIVSQFLQANGWDEKSTFVRDVERVKPLMKDHYERQGGGEAAEVTKIVSTAPSFYANSDLKDPVSNVTAELADGEVRNFRVEFINGKPLIEWEASVAYNARNWDQIVSDSSGEPQMLRVAASLDKYWNYQFSDDREYLSVHLIDPVTKISLGNGYIARSSEDGARLRQFLATSSKRRPEQVTIMVRPVEKSREHRMVEIVQFVKGGFRTLDTLASNARNESASQ